MKLLKWIFSLKSLSKRYVNEILLLCYLIITTLIVVIASNCFELSKTIDRILGIIILLQWILLFIPCMSRILSIIDYNMDIKIKNGELKSPFFYLSIALSIKLIASSALTPSTSIISSVSIFSARFRMFSSEMKFFLPSASLLFPFSRMR